MADKKTDEAPDVPAADVRPGYDVTVGDVTHRIPHPVKGERGAQVVLDGIARTAARGGASGDITGNTIVRDLAVAAGQAGDGTTPDGSTPDGRLPPDVATQHEPYSDPGQGEGKPGFRPGDAEVAQAEAKAAQERADARTTAVQEAATQAAAAVKA